jgi:hypothetical protein
VEANDVRIFAAHTTAIVLGIIAGIAYRMKG